MAIMQVQMTILDASNAEHDIEVTAKTDVSAAMLFRHLGMDDEPAHLSSASGPVALRALIGGPGLRSGCQLSLASKQNNGASRTSVLVLRVLSGPDSGKTAALSMGSHVVGRAADADIAVNDRDLSRRHCELTVSSYGISIRDLGSTNGTIVSGVMLTGLPSELGPGELVEIGQSVFAVEAVSEPPAAVRAGSDGMLLVNRPPRFGTDDEDRAVEFPGRDTDRRRPRTQWMATLLPAALGLGMAAVMHSVMFLAFSMLGPVSMVATGFSDRRAWRRDLGSAQVSFQEQTERAQLELDAGLAAETQRRRRRHPDACAIARAAATPDCRLWERRPADPDFLSVRIGSADQRAQLRVISVPPAGKPPTVPFVPAVVSVAAGHVGLAGPQAFVSGLSRWMLGQIFALHSPNDVTVVALLDSDEGESMNQWRWLRWTNTQVAITPRERAEALDELVATIIDRRLRTQQGLWTGPHIVVLLDPVAASAAIAGLHTVLKDGPGVGITALCLANDQRLLPHECRVVIGFDSVDGSRLNARTAGKVLLEGVRCERVSIGWADKLARDLAPLREVNAAGVTTLPASVRLSDAAGVQHIDASGLLDSWALGRSPSASLGIGPNGPLVIDLLRDGPHGLIAGSTGSGKSELLRSFVAGLSMVSAPDTLAFVLIDYKGGAAFAECAELPHTVAVITDLDHHLTQRALISLNAELRRRETAFAAVGVSDLQDFVSRGHCADTPMPRLVIIVDEFAALADELPDFISGLVGVAQRGRSLGVHLFLATQRPGGVVSPEIKANMALRIALRVTDSAESADVIGTGAAAAISKSRPGRGYIKLADGLAEFQAAQVSIAARTTEDVEIKRLDEWNRPIGSDSAEQDSKLELQLIVQAAKDAAAILAAPVPPPVWLAPLPAQLTTSALPEPSAARYCIAYGLLDSPSSQCQPAMLHDLAAGGSLAFIGGPKSGRTTALRTLAGVATGQLQPADLQLYVIDCAGGALIGLAVLPTCATALAAEEPASIARLVDRLSAELNRRQAELAAHGLSDFAEARAIDIALPAVLVLLDGWEGFTALSENFDGGRTADTFARLLREGPTVGFTVVVAGDRALLGIRISAVIAHKMLLRLTERSDYAVAGLDPRGVAENMPPGRGVLGEDGTEFHLAVLGSDCSATGQWNAIKAMEVLTPFPQSSYAPICIRPLPQRVAFQELGGGGGISLGRGGDDAREIVTELTEPGSRFLITGPARSGRSWTARLIAAQAHARGVDLLIAAPSRSPLAKWALENQIRVLAPHTEAGVPSSFAGLIIIDDAEAFNDTHVATCIQELIAEEGSAVIACARSDELMVSFRGIAVTVRRHRTGILLAPSAADGELLGIRVPSSPGSGQPGRGLLLTDELRATYPNGLPIQIAASQE